MIEYDDVAACERARESRSTLGGLFRRRERGVALLLTSGRRVTIGARGASAEEVCGKIENAIVKYKRQKATAAVETTREDARRRASGASAATAGVGGAVNRQLERAEATNKTMDEAFTDLRALMAKAGEMVTLAERLAESMDGKGESSELQRLVLSLGITSPVTRASAGAEFHRELGQAISGLDNARGAKIERHHHRHRCVLFVQSRARHGVSFPARHASRVRIVGLARGRFALA